jgi:hypothetical protein
MISQINIVVIIHIIYIKYWNLSLQKIKSQDTINSHDADWCSICDKLGIKPISTAVLFT